MRSHLLTGLTGLLLLAGVPTARADRVALPDSTVIESFRLGNGLRVVTRHVPLCGSIAVTLSFDQGYRDDPAGRDGFTRVLARLRYFGATAGEPARTEAQMSDLRPSGWDWSVVSRVTHLSEVASLGQFPGMLHQMAARLQGVQITDADLKQAIAETQREMALNYRESLDRALFFRLRAVAEGADEAAIGKRAEAKTLQSVSLRDAKSALAALGPSRAVLSVVGDLSVYPVRNLIEKEFGSIPSGPAAPARKSRPLAAGNRTTIIPRMDFPLGSIGILAPALDDSLHPAFYAAALKLGSFCTGEWGRPDPPLYSRFKVLLLDEPELAVYYPPLSIEDQLDLQMPSLLAEAAHRSLENRAPETIRGGLLRGVQWLLGGPAPPEVLAQARGGGAALITLANSAGTRALWGDEAFWALYRERFRRSFEEDRTGWAGYFEDPSHRVTLLLIPEVLSH